MCDNLTTKATDMASSISSSDSFEAVASVQEVAELKADLAEKTTEIDNLKEEVRGLKERDARKSRQLETLTQKVRELEALENKGTDEHRAKPADGNDASKGTAKKSDGLEARQLLSLTDQMQTMRALLKDLQKGIPKVCGKKVTLKASNGKFVSGHNGVTPVSADSEQPD
ncbi:hypothetical protein AAVH_29412, partial [Aphelenchoides avenae]